MVVPGSHLRGAPRDGHVEGDRGKPPVEQGLEHLPRPIDRQAVDALGDVQHLREVRRGDPPRRIPRTWSVAAPPTRNEINA